MSLSTVYINKGSRQILQLLKWPCRNHFLPMWSSRDLQLLCKENLSLLHAHQLSHVYLTYSETYSERPLPWETTVFLPEGCSTCQYIWTWHQRSPVLWEHIFIDIIDNGGGEGVLNFHTGSTENSIWMYAGHLYTSVYLSLQAVQGGRVIVVLECKSDRFLTCVAKVRNPGTFSLPDSQSPIIAWARFLESNFRNNWQDHLNSFFSSSGAIGMLESK